VRRQRDQKIKGTADASTVALAVAVWPPGGAAVAHHTVAKGVGSDLDHSGGVVLDSGN